jgi:hypothetical protein
MGEPLPAEKHMQLLHQQERTMISKTYAPERRQEWKTDSHLLNYFLNNANYILCGQLPAPK